MSKFKVSRQNFVDARINILKKLKYGYITKLVTVPFANFFSNVKFDFSRVEPLYL